LLQEKKLDRAVVGKPARRLDAGVVQNQEITWPNELGQINELAVGDRLPRPVEDQHACILAPGKRPGSNPTWGEDVIVIAQAGAHFGCRKEEEETKRKKRGKEKDNLGAHLRKLEEAGYVEVRK
jgi:hypothetical protein